ncbi:hypothetical protein [Kitasatospora sp. LaBMicrA B282]|uniref:hypothetical protein n=1 Tax=Kitasatospora sp. LaBMicrA B282 TaxID=3420949 RepID=UPI003D124926
MTPLRPTAEQQRTERRAQLAARCDPLADYDPDWFSRITPRRPAGWPPCQCDAPACPDREVRE